MRILRTIVGLIVLTLSGASPEVSMAQSAQNSAQVGTQQKVFVIYHSWATDKDKQRVRTMLNGRVTGTFADPDTEEVTIAIPKSCDRNKFIQKRLAAAKKDPAVERTQLTAKYSLN